jgi:hypothetical protein
MGELQALNSTIDLGDQGLETKRSQRQQSSAGAAAGGDLLILLFQPSAFSIA